MAGRKIISIFATDISATAGKMAVGSFPFMWPRAATGSGGQYVSVSSTKIRKLLSEGDVEGARVMLGYEYGLTLTIRFRRRIRDERVFPSLDDLRLQLEQDRELCRNKN